jgi:hypothetical protein
VLGPLAGIVIQPLSLIFGFMEAHETSGGRAVLAVVLPFLATAFCCVTPILILLLPAIQKAVEAAH